jgi:hypothetical protein
VTESPAHPEFDVAPVVGCCLDEENRLRHDPEGCVPATQAHMAKYVDSGSVYLSAAHLVHTHSVAAMAREGMDVLSERHADVHAADLLSRARTPGRGAPLAISTPTMAEERAAASLWRRLPLGDPGAARAVLARALAEHRTELLAGTTPTDQIEAAAQLLYRADMELANQLRGPSHHNTWTGLAPARRQPYLDRALQLAGLLQAPQPPVETTELVAGPSALETLAQAVLDGRVSLWTSDNESRVQTRTDIQVDPPREEPTS